MNRLKFAFTALPLVTALFASSAQAQVNEQALRELRILTGIFETVLEEENSGAGNFFRGEPEILYLPGKGAVLTLSAGSGFIAVTRALPTNLLINENFDFNVDGVETVSIAQSNAGATSAGIEVLRETASRQSQAVAEARQAIAEQEAQVAQLNASLTQAMVGQPDADRSVDLNEIRERLRVASEGLRERQQQFSRAITENRERAAAEQQAQAEAMAGTLTATLCDYGRTLRSLGNDEFVTLVLKNFSGQQSRVMLFDAGDVKSCDDADSLMGNATVYDM